MKSPRKNLSVYRSLEQNKLRKTVNGKLLSMKSTLDQIKDFSNDAVIVNSRNEASPARDPTLRGSDLSDPESPTRISKKLL